MKVKVSDVAKTTGVSYTTLIAELDRLQVEVSKSPNAYIPEDLVDTILVITLRLKLGLPTDSLTTRGKKLNDSERGMFVGVIFDSVAKKFATYKVRLHQEELKGLDSEFISNQSTIYGSIVELPKSIVRFFNEQTVKRF